MSKKAIDYSILTIEEPGIKKTTLNVYAETLDENNVIKFYFDTFDNTVILGENIDGRKTGTCELSIYEARMLAKFILAACDSMDD